VAKFWTDVVEFCDLTEDTIATSQSRITQNKKRNDGNILGLNSAVKQKRKQIFRRRRQTSTFTASCGYHMACSKVSGLHFWHFWPNSLKRTTPWSSWCW